MKAESTLSAGNSVLFFDVDSIRSISLNNKGFNNLILVDDFKKSEKWKNLIGKKYIEFVSKFDLLQWLYGRESDIEAIIHLGACSDTQEKDGDYFMDNNYRYSTVLAEYALKNGHRFIYASSAATYGKGEEGFSDNHDILDELSPLNLYAYSKHAFDLWLKRQNVLDKVVGLKYFNVFGPNEYHKEKMASMVFHITNQILNNSKAKLFKSKNPEKYEDGEQCRDFLYVKDAVAMTCNFLNNDLCGIYNIGSSVATSWNYLVKTIFDILDKKEEIEYFSMPQNLEDKYQEYTCADMNKYYLNLKEKPKKFSIKENIKDYLNNYLLKGKYL